MTKGRALEEVAPDLRADSLLRSRPCTECRADRHPLLARGHARQSRPPLSASTFSISRSSPRRGARRRLFGACSTRPPFNGRPRTSRRTSPARLCARSSRAAATRAGCSPLVVMRMRSDGTINGCARRSARPARPRLRRSEQEGGHSVGLDQINLIPATGSAACSPCWRRRSGRRSATSTPPSATATTALPRHPGLGLSAFDDELQEPPRRTCATKRAELAGNWYEKRDRRDYRRASTASFHAACPSRIRAGSPSATTTSAGSTASRTRGADESTDAEQSDTPEERNDP